MTAAVSFDYDDRGRLIGETRVEGGSTTKYDLAYTYDQVGNRLTKMNAVTDMLTVYVYDVHCTPDAAGDDMEMNTHNNRLLAYRVYDGDDPQTDNLLRTVRYTYYDNGNVANITLKDDYVSGVTGGTEADYDWYHDLMLHYWADGTVRAAMWSKWKLNASGEPINVEFGDAREFHYDTPIGSPRQRFLTIDFDTNDKDDEPNGWTPAEPVSHTDYLGASAYNDGEITYDTQSSTWEISDTMNYLAGQWQKDLSDSEMQYYHGDLIGSAMLTTDANADDVSTVAYSAFGELLDSSGTPGGDAPSGFPRYQYAGEFGYESGLITLNGVNPDLPPLTFQHLGWRWYQPDIGRFVQRDPVGLRGGLNVYSYVDSSPCVGVDPTGLLSSVPTHLIPGWDWHDFDLFDLLQAIKRDVTTGAASGLAKGAYVGRPAEGALTGAAAGLATALVTDGLLYGVDGLWFCLATTVNEGAEEAEDFWDDVWDKIPSESDLRRWILRRARMYH